MSVIRRLYNVAKGKAIVARTPSDADPALADEPLRPFDGDDAAIEDDEDDIPTVEDRVAPDGTRPTGPRPRTL